MSILVRRDRFTNTLNEFCVVVVVLGFEKVFTITDTEALVSGIFGWERESGRSEVNTEGRDLVSRTTAISLRACCSSTNW